MVPIGGYPGVTLLQACRTGIGAASPRTGDWLVVCAATGPGAGGPASNPFPQSADIVVSQPTS